MTVCPSSLPRLSESLKSKCSLNRWEATVLSLTGKDDQRWKLKELTEDCPRSKPAAGRAPPAPGMTSSKEKALRSEAKGSSETSGKRTVVSCATELKIVESFDPTLNVT
eukprot:evm.model.NODE_5287_length_31514_cov_28.831980.3